MRQTCSPVARQHRGTRRYFILLWPLASSGSQARSPRFVRNSPRANRLSYTRPSDSNIPQMLFESQVIALIIGLIFYRSWVELGNLAPIFHSLY